MGSLSALSLPTSKEAGCLDAWIAARQDLAHLLNSARYCRKKGAIPNNHHQADAGRSAQAHDQRGDTQHHAQPQIPNSIKGRLSQNGEP